MAVLKLKGIASLWYENVQRQRVREGRARIRSWSKLQKLTTKRFLPTYSEHDLYLGVSSSNREHLGEEKSKKECEPLQISRGMEETLKVTHLASNLTMEEEEQEEAATISLAEENTQEEGQRVLSAKESIQGENQKELLVQPRCTKPVQVTSTSLITPYVSDLREGVVSYVLPMDAWQSKGVRHLVKGATHQGRPKVGPLKLGGQKHTLIPLLFAITVWDPAVGVKVFIEQPWDLRTNPFKEGEFDAWGNPPKCPNINQGLGSQ